MYRYNIHSASLKGTYLVLLCALRELLELRVQHGELASDALYSGVQTPVLTVLCIEVIFIALTLLLGANHHVLPG